MSFQDVVILLLAAGIVGTWVVGARLLRRVTRELDEVARDRVEPDDVQASVGRTLGQLQVAADNLADALATRTERLNELLDLVDARAVTLGEAMSAAVVVEERLATEILALDRLGARPGGPVTGGVLETAPTLGPSPAAAGEGSTTTPPHGNGVPNGVPNGTTALAVPAGGTLAIGGASPGGPLVRVPVTPVVEPHGASVGADEVRRLARDGISPTEIARRTNRGREEVRLLLRFAGVGVDDARLASVSPGPGRLAARGPSTSPRTGG